MEEQRERWWEKLDWEDWLLIGFVLICIGVLILGGDDEASASCSFESHPDENGQVDE